MTLRIIALSDLLAHVRAGERSACDELLARCRNRLEGIAHAMLRRFPAVAAHEQTADVVQVASLSLLAALRGLDVADTRSFYGLAAHHVRLRLLDLARKYRPRQGVPASDPDADLERWSALHEAAEHLPVESREVFSLRFYHGWTFAEIATLLGASVPTARRRWLEAVAELREQLKGELPE